MAEKETTKPGRMLFVESETEVADALKRGCHGVYAGNAFCARGLPAVDEALRMAGAATGNGLSFHFATPVMNETMLEKGRSLAAALEKNFPGIEIIANDIGFLYILKKEFPGLIPVAGRVIAAQRTDPVVPHIISAEFKGESGEKKIRELGHVSVNNSRFGDFLNSLGVTRIEIQNPLQGVRPGNEKFSYSLHTPFVYVSSTGACVPVENYLKKGRAPGQCRCDGHCGEKYFHLRSGGSRPMFFRGNTVFYENNALPAHPLIDRVVEHLLPS